MKGRLYICATPIGNLEDVTLRLLRVLGEVDVIAAEDTRHTRKLLSRHEISARLVSYRDTNERKEAERLADQMMSGSTVALVTDSGMPSISDPGYRLVQACIERDIPIEVLPGPSAALAALVVSGLPTDRFAFEGFLSKKAGDRSRRLDRLVSEDRTMIFYEAPGRVVQTLKDLKAAFGDRRVALARELTKVHEEVLRGTITEVLAATSDGDVIGEVVIVVEGAPHDPHGSDRSGSLQEALEYAISRRNAGESTSRAASDAANRFGIERRAVYQALVDPASGEKGSHDRPLGLDSS